jgi:hypothetical protein
MQKRRRGSTERFVGLRYWMLNSPAWRSLPCNARALYVEIVQRYNGGNNGRIPYSLREAVQALRVGKHTALRLFAILQERGFIVCTKKGAFSMKAVRDASEWCLTEYPNDFPPQHATKKFMSWVPPELAIDDLPKSRTRVLSRTRTGAQANPRGCSVKPANIQKGADGCYLEPANAQNASSTGSKQHHLQLPGTDGGERSAPEGSAVASEPHEWRAIAYPSGSPSREEHLAALERAALERGRSPNKRRAGGA